MAKILHKRNDQPGVKPLTTEIELGEIAINIFDGKAFIKKTVQGQEEIVQVGIDKLNELTDIDISNLEDGQLLKWDSNQSSWVPSEDQDTTYTAGTGLNIDANNSIKLDAILNDLNDVDTSGIADSQILKWDASQNKWLPADDYFEPSELQKITEDIKPGGDY